MKPIVGITMGDAAGIGPEIIVRSLSTKELYGMCRPLVIGDAGVMRKASRIVGGTLKINSVSKVEEARFVFGIIDVLDMKNICLKNLKPRQVNLIAGKAAVEYIEIAVELALADEIHAIATAPINKEAINKAGYNYAGHTELLAHLTKTEDYAMMLVEGSLRIIHVTTHVSLRRACEMIKKQRVLRTIKLARDTLRQIGINDPRIGVAGLNPHGGERGLFGSEEMDEILPAVESAKREGMNAIGPLPPDTIFAKAKGGAFDVVVAMYHDQGHIPVKLLGLKWDEETEKWESVSGINVTVGLPIIRSSVDHGTAYGKAWKGTANPQSMIEAIKYASTAAQNRQK